MNDELNFSNLYILNLELLITLSNVVEVEGINVGDMFDIGWIWLEKILVKNLQTAGWGIPSSLLAFYNFYVLAFLDGLSYFFRCTFSPLTHVCGVWIFLGFKLQYIDGELLGWTDPQEQQTLFCTALRPYFRLLKSRN